MFHFLRNILLADLDINRTFISCSVGEQDGLLMLFFYHSLTLSVSLIRLFLFPGMVDCGL